MYISYVYLNLLYYMQRTIFEQNLEDYIPTGPAECKYFCPCEFYMQLI